MPPWYSGTALRSTTSRFWQAGITSCISPCRITRAKIRTGERKDICYPTTKEFRGELEANILLALENLQQTGQKKYLVGDGQDRELPFTVSVTPFEKENRSIRGLARIYLDDCFAVSNISIVMGKNGLFVSMPSYKTNQIDENNRSVYRDICYPVTGEFREKVNNLLTDAYEKAVAEVQENVLGQADGFMPVQDSSDMDFPDMDLPTR